MNDPTATVWRRLDAAKALLPYEHVRMDQRGKKDVQAERAAKQGTSERFRPTPHPGLRVVSGEGL